MNGAFMLKESVEGKFLGIVCSDGLDLLGGLSPDKFEETLNEISCFRFVPHQMDPSEPCCIINNGEKILLSPRG